MGAMSTATCPHGLPRGTCEICRVMEPAPALHARAARPVRRGGFPGGVVSVVVVAIVGFVVVGWVVAAFFAVLRILELVAVAAVAGWVGWKVGVHHGRRGG